MAGSHCDQNDGLNQFLAVLLGDTVDPVSQSCALPAFAGSQGSTCTNVPSDTQKVKSLKGLRRQVRQLEDSLQQQQQQELKQQVHKHLYLTERASLLEQLVSLHELQEARLAEVKAGLKHNPFAAWNCTVQEILDAKPAQWSQRFNHIVQVMAKRLAAVTPLLQKYPRLVAHKPPAEQLQQLVRELSVSEPTNPYGADGLPLGTLTVPVPTHVLQMFATMYGIDISSMGTAERSMLETLAVMVVEQDCVSKGLMYSHLGFGFIIPSLYRTPPVDITELALHPSWQSLTSTLNSLTVNAGPDQQGSAASVADEAHWHKVVAFMQLTDKQKLQTKLLCEVVNDVKAAIQAKRAQLARALLSLHSPSGSADVLLHATSDLQQLKTRTKPSYHVAGSLPPTAAQQQQAGHSDAQAGVQRAGSSSEDATAVYRLTADQLAQQEILMWQIEDCSATERSLMGILTTALTFTILSRVQMCLFAVHSYPYMPSHLSVISAAAATCTPEVMDALAAAAAHGHAKEPAG